MNYREISAYFRNEYARRKHPHRYCNICELPVMKNCTTDETHDIIDITEVYKTQRRQHRNFISILKSDVLFNRNILFVKTKTDYEASQQKISILNLALMARAERLKSFLVKVSCCYNNLIVKKCYKRNVHINRYIASIQWYEQTYEQSAITPVQFLLFFQKKLLTSS